MARQLVALALIFIAAVGMASASSQAAAPATNPAVSSPEESPDPFDDTVIGTLGGSVDAAPVGGPVPEGAFPDISPPSPLPKSHAITLEVTTFAGVAVAAATVAGSFFF